MAGDIKLVTESFLQSNFIPNGEIITGVDAILSMDCTQIKGRYQVDISGVTSTGVRCPSQNQLGREPDVITINVHDISQTEATVDIEIKSENGFPITERGVCWGTTVNPTAASNKIISISSESIYTVTLTGLTLNTTYYVRGYAINAIGVGYGYSIPFTTSFTQTMSPWIEDPYIKVAHIGCTQGVYNTGAVIYHGIESTGEAPIRSGIIWRIADRDPSFENGDSYVTDGVAGDHVGCSTIAGLTEATRYAVRAWGQNSLGYAYSNTIFFVTTAAVPVIPALGDIYEGGMIVEAVEESDRTVYMVISNIINPDNPMDWWDGRSWIRNTLGDYWDFPTNIEAGRIRTYLQSILPPAVSALNIPLNKTYWLSNLRYSVLFGYDAPVLRFSDQSAHYYKPAKRDDYYVFGIKYTFKMH